MQHRRLKQLRMSFGVDQNTMAGLLGVPVEEWRAWEVGEAPIPAATVAAISERFGLSPRWLAGEEETKWAPRVLELQRWLVEEMLDLRGIRFVEMLQATTGERIAYVINLLRRADPDLFTLETVACWLGLSVGSTQLLLAGELDVGSPVIARASDLTGIPERWFRAGPGDGGEAGWGNRKPDKAEGDR